jgi:hypothetical protein
MEEKKYKEDIDVSSKKLTHAWNLILSAQYMKLASDTSLEEGSGFSIFKFLKPRSKPDLNPEPNCEYFYAEKDSMPWDMFIKILPRKEEFLKVYDSSNMFAVLVSVPNCDIGDDTIQSMRLFKYSDKIEEVEY